MLNFKGSKLTDAFPTDNCRYIPAQNSRKFTYVGLTMLRRGILGLVILVFNRMVDFNQSGIFFYEI